MCSPSSPLLIARFRRQKFHDNKNRVQFSIMFYGLALLRYVVAISLLSANLAFGNSLQIKPYQSISSRVIADPELRNFTLGGHLKIESLTQAMPAACTQASREDCVAGKKAPVTRKQISGTVARATPTTTDPNNSLNLNPAAPTTFTSVPRSGSSDCGFCTFSALVS